MTQNNANKEQGEDVEYYRNWKKSKGDQILPFDIWNEAMNYARRHPPLPPAQSDEAAADLWAHTNGGTSNTPITWGYQSYLAGCAHVRQQLSQTEAIMQEMAAKLELVINHAFDPTETAQVTELLTRYKQLKQ
jgi:hypothetical protein